MDCNKSLESISRVCKEVIGIKETIVKFVTVSGIHKKSLNHTTTKSMTDEINIIKDIQKLNPFECIPRAHESFQPMK